MVKVRRIWVCECEGSQILSPVNDHTQLIIRGTYFLTRMPVGGSARVTCRGCSDYHEVAPMVVPLTKPLKKIWTCRCEATSAVKCDDGTILLKGAGHGVGYHPTKVRCTECGDTHRIAPEVVHYTEMQSQHRKRTRMRKNRR